MSVSVVVRSPSGAFSAWRASTLSALGLKEGDLEAAILANPGILVLDAIGVMHERVAVFDQRRLRSGAGHTDIPDVIRWRTRRTRGRIYAGRRRTGSSRAASG